MEETVAIMASLALIAFIVAEIRRVVGALLLHRSINIALRHDPAAAAALTARLAPARTMPWTLPGWLLLTASAVLLVIALFAEAEERRSGIETTMIVAVLGLAWLLLARRLDRAPDAAPPPA